MYRGLSSLPCAGRSLRYARLPRDFGGTRQPVGDIWARHPLTCDDASPESWFASGGQICIYWRQPEEAAMAGGRPRIYPWGEWLDGQERLLVIGTDVRADVRFVSFRHQAYAEARRRGLRVSVL